MEPTVQRCSGTLSAARVAFIGDDGDVSLSLRERALLFIRSNARFERYPQTMRQRSIRVFTRGQFLLQPRYFFFQTYSPGRGGQGYYFMPICQRIAREVIGQAVMILSRFVMRLSRDMGH
jgi:hypothetical protein